MTDRPSMPAIEDLERLVGQRRSCRAFQSDPVPRPIIERLLGAAQRSASWCNSQPWQVVVTSGEGTRRLREALQAAVRDGVLPRPDFAFPREYVGVYQERRRESGFQLYESLGIARGDRQAYGRQASRNFAFFDAPHVAIVTSAEALGTYGAVDCGGYVATFLLAAQALGLGAIAQAALAMQSPILKRGPRTRRGPACRLRDLVRLRQARSPGQCLPHPAAPHWTRP